MMSQVENLEARDFALEVCLQSTGERLLLCESGAGDCGCPNESNSSGACLWRLRKEAEARILHPLFLATAVHQHEREIAGWSDFISRRHSSQAARHLESEQHRTANSEAQELTTKAKPPPSLPGPLNAEALASLPLAGPE